VPLALVISFALALALAARAAAVAVGAAAIATAARLTAAVVRVVVITGLGIGIVSIRGVLRNLLRAAAGLTAVVRAGVVRLADNAVIGQVAVGVNSAGGAASFRRAKETVDMLLGILPEIAYILLISSLRLHLLAASFRVQPHVKVNS
jgi:hypothetical protein